ncbi:MAG: acyl-CoA dehydrogenase family protein, partial [Actinobacteria bacterium]|nr:acyl-CoA dehydrogenase family protein [Actinomycetota bacterium]
MTVLDAARELAPVLSERAAEGEEARTMPADLVEQVRAAGLFHMAMPEALGGPPRDPATIIEVVEELARADGSAAWTTLIGNATCFAAWLEPSVALKVLSTRPDGIAAGSFTPGGQAVPNGDGSFTVSGRWPFASGAPHADWFVNGVLVMDGQGPSGPLSGEFVPRMLENGLPDWRFVWLPAADVEVLDTWRAAGLRGTGSHHVAAEGVRVPVEHTAAPLYERARAEDAFFRMPFWSLLMVIMAGFPLGVARRALDEFVGLTEGKSRRFDRRLMSEDEIIQVEVARLDGALGSARAYV